MSDLLKIAAALLVLALGSRFDAWGAPPKSGGKVFPYPVSTTVLDNGLKVIAVPFDSPGLIACWTIVRTGSRNEIEPGKSGFAHFFEHMMFRGTDRYSREKYNDVFKELGSDHNAFTSDDFTAYHALAPATALEQVLDLESDRFMNLKYTADDFKKEAGAVLGEYNKNASNPFLLLHEKLRDTAFTRHSYKHTTMGFLKDIEAMPDQYEYSLTFFDRFYRPENCVLLVVGDVDPKKLATLARKYFGGWKRGSYKFDVPAEPPQTAEKRIDLTWPNPTQPYLYIGYHTPAFSTTSKQMPALDLVSQMLFSDAAPLYQKLVVEEQEVDLLSGGASDHRDPYLFEIVARVKRPDRVAYVEAAIGAALEEIKTKPVEMARLQRVQSHMKYSYAMGLSTAGSVASGLAHYLMLTGDPESVNQVYALYDQVTPEDLRAAAASCFLPAGRTVVTLRFAGDAPASGGSAPATGAAAPGAGAAAGRGRR